MNILKTTICILLSVLTIQCFGIIVNASEDNPTLPTVNYSVDSKVGDIRILNLKFYSDVGIQGYYFGTSADYHNNYFKYSGDTAQEVIKKPNAYFLTVKDNNGNISKKQLIVFYKNVYDAKGGSVSPESVLLLSSEKFQDPIPYRNGYVFTGWDIGVGTSQTVDLDENGETIIYSSGGTDHYYAKWVKKQEIIAKSCTKTYGAKAFSLNATTNGNGKLTYKSSNDKVATVSSKGNVTIKGCGRTTITIKAAETLECLEAIKKITITIKPGKVKLKSKRLYRSGKKYCIKQYFKKQRNCDCYESQMSPKKNFPKVYIKPKYIKKS